MPATATTISTAVLLLLLPLAISAVGNDFIITNCKTTLYPDVCIAKLIPKAGIIQASPSSLASVALHESLSSATRVSSLLSKKPKSNKVIQDCVSTYGDAIDQMHKSKTALQGKLDIISIDNMQTWMSAALTNEDTCEEGLESVKSDLLGRVVESKKLTSITLTFINKLA